MALGSKGDRDRNGGGGSGGRGRPYGVMLLLAFGAAVLGVMVLHKLRERRICTLLIKDKDHDLMHLQFLLEKERESVKEMKRKNEELKAKTNSLRTQKMELINKVAATQSITSSLKEEQRVMETTLQEKQSELNSQIAALKELLKQKEDEIEEMKKLVEKPSKIWSVSSDDPSNRTVNLNMPVGLEISENITEAKNSSDGMKLKHVGRSRMVVASVVRGEHGRRRTTRRKIVSGDSENRVSYDAVVNGRSDQQNGETNGLEVDTQSGVSGENNFKLYEHSKDEGLREVPVMNGKINLKEDDRHAAGEKVEEMEKLGGNDGVLTSERQVEKKPNSEDGGGSTMEENQIDTIQGRSREDTGDAKRPPNLKETNATTSQSGSAGKTFQQIA